MAYTLKFYDQFTGESSDVEIQNHTPTDQGTSWSVTSNNTNNPDVDQGTSTLVQAYHTGPYRQGCIANISGGWNETVDTVKQRGEWLPQQWSKLWPTLYLNESAGGNPQGYSAIWALDFWRIIRYDDGSTAFTTVVFGDYDTGGSTKHNLVIQLTCEPGSQEASFDGGTYTATGGTDETYDTGVPGVSSYKSIAADGVDWVKFYEDAGATPVTASGTPTLTAVTASGAVTTEIGAYGTPSITAITATGLVGHINEASGTPSLTAVTASGAVTTEIGAYGTATLTALTATGSVDTTQQILEASGTATATAMTADGYGYRTTVSITSVSEDDVYDDGSAGIVIVGTNFVN